MTGPQILVLSKPTDTEFKWQSVGWNNENNKHTPESKALFAKAKACIVKAATVTDVIELLTEAGFDCVIPEGQDELYADIKRWLGERDAAPLN